MLFLGATLAAAVVVACIPFDRADGHIIIFKDGFVLEGRLSEKTTYFTDKSGQGFTVPAGKPYWIFDGYRNVFFSPNQLQDAVGEEAKKLDLVKLNKLAPNKGTGKLPPTWEITKTSNWDDRWERTVSLSLPGNKRMEITQRIIALTPDYIRVHSASVDWVTCYKTQELSGQVLRALIYNHPDVKKEKDLDQRLIVYRFFMQAGMLTDATAELEQLKRKFPDQQSSVEPLLDGIKRQQTGLFIESMQRSHKAGLFQDVAARLARYDKENLDKQLDEKTQLQVQAIREKHEALKEKIKDASSLLQRFAAGNVGSPVHREFFQKCTKEILEELNQDTVGRLETFIS